MAHPAETVLVLGGARSGKSSFAEGLAARACARVGASTLTFVATGLPEGAGDPDWDARIAAHRTRRPSAWTTREMSDREVPELGTVLEAIGEPALVDSLGSWVARLGSASPDLAELVDALRTRSARGDPTLLVSEEVGLGVHPSSEAGRSFRDLLGEVNQAVAGVADRVVLVVAGRALELTGQPVGEG